jgi:hypothetical protein
LFDRPKLTTGSSANGRIRSLGNCRFCSVPYNFPKIFESVIHNNVSYSFKSIFNRCQRGFVKSISTVAIFARRLHVVSPPIHFQRQFDVVYGYEFNNILKLFCEMCCIAYLMVREWMLRTVVSYLLTEHDVACLLLRRSLITIWNAASTRHATASSEHYH